VVAEAMGETVTKGAESVEGGQGTPPPPPRVPEADAEAEAEAEAEAVACMIGWQAPQLDTNPWQRS